VNHQPPLIKSDVEQPRSPVELLTWVTAKCEELGSTPENKKYARSGASLPKKFYNEVRPLALFAWHEFCDHPNILVTPNLSNENFDGVIYLPDGSPLHIEITYAKDGYKDDLRMEVLTQQGHVNALTPVTVVGTRHSPNRHIDIPNEVVNHDSIVAEHLRYVTNRLIGKTNKSYGSNHVLVVIVDDHIAFRDNIDVQTLNSLVMNQLSHLKLDFGRLVMLGASGKLFLSYAVTPNAK
jgi:hypothetical protein